MKIKFVSNYSNPEDLKVRVEAACITGSNYDSRIEIVTGQEYDFLVVLNGYPELRVEDKNRTIGFIQEPSWSSNIQKDLPKYCQVLYTHAPEMFKDFSNVKYHSAFGFYDDSHKMRGSFPREIFDRDNGFNKAKKLSIIISNLQKGPKSSIYHERMKLMDKILKSNLDIDIFGRGWQLSDLRYKGELPFKRLALRPYEYSIAIENSNEIGYCTEKISDCFLNNAIPLYWGAPNVNEIYDPRSFEIINPDDEDVIDKIKEIIKKPSIQYRKAVLGSKRVYLGKYNIYNFLKEILLI